MTHQTCSKPTVSSFVGLVILTTIIPATLTFRHIRASQNEPILVGGPQDGPEPPSLVKDQERALAEFLDTYRLAPGQDLKRIPPPRPKGIRVWYIRQRPRLGDIGGLQDIRAMAFAWRDPDQLHVSSSMFGRSEGWTIRDLPRWLGMGLYSYDIEGDLELLKTEVGGDWIVREGIPAEVLVQPLEAILQRAIRQRITLALRRWSARSWSPAAGIALRLCRVALMERSRFTPANPPRTMNGVTEWVPFRPSSGVWPSGSDVRS